MIYQNILTNGRGYGKPHVTKHGCGHYWIANYRGCFAIGFTPSCAVRNVLAFYDEWFPGVREK